MGVIDDSSLPVKVGLPHESRCSSSFFYQPDAIHHANTMIEDSEDFIDLHPTGPVAVAKDGANSGPLLHGSSFQSNAPIQDGFTPKAD